ncbi:MAG: tRNA (N6-threonylcarbamoyladenosine(37)-N6)-methyltransferase TrmO [Clostridia bacterium]
MTKSVEMQVIAYIHNDFKTKFGLPRQSGLVEEVTSVIVFEPPYRDPAAFRGIEDYSHLWLVWQFSEAKKEHWSATVRPPRLGGNRRMGVFATRSPYRPNPIGLSSVNLADVVMDEKNGPLLYVTGADLMDGTPILDIKPYLAFTDSHPDAEGGFAAAIDPYRLEVDFPEELLAKIPEEKQAALLGALKEDPRPSYQEDPDRIYGLAYGSFDVRFYVREGRLTVVEVRKE